jgi:hypothetical protein
MAPQRPDAAPAARARQAAQNPTARGSKRVRRSLADVQGTAEQALAYIKANAGQRLEEIGHGLGVATAGLKLPIKKLIADKQLRTEGQKRGTRYFAGSGGSAVRRRAKASRRKK